MPKGKRPRLFKVAFPPINFKPRIAIIGHSMPKRLFRAFDSDSLIDGTNELISSGVLTQQQSYARYFHVDNFIADIFFFHCATVMSKKFEDAVIEAGNCHPDIVIFHASSNDMATKECNVKKVFHRIIDMTNLLITQFEVGAIMFVSVLKREDVPLNGKGRLLCSKAEFRLRAKLMNKLLKREAKHSYDLVFVLLPRFWYDIGTREIEVNEWSSDRLHPGPNIGSEGFARYFHGLRHVLLLAVPFLAQAIFLKRHD